MSQPSYSVIVQQQELPGTFFDEEEKKTYRLAAALEGTFTFTPGGVCTRADFGSKVTVESGGLAQGMPGSRLIIKAGGRGIAEADCHVTVYALGKARGKKGAHIIAHNDAEVIAEEGCEVEIMQGARVFLRPGALYRRVCPEHMCQITFLPAAD